MSTIFQIIYDSIGWVVEQIGFLGIVIVVATLFLGFNAIQRANKFRKLKKQNNPDEFADYFE